MALTGAAAEHFERQADACDRLGSPFTARLCRLLAAILDDTSETGRRIIGWPDDPRGDALALRLCGGLHRLALSGAEPLAAVYPPESAGDDDLERALRAALLRHDGVLRAALDRPPQTNEIARSAMLLPGFLAVARETGLPLQLAEIGCSAGLNLLFDRFSYRYGDAAWGEPNAPVRLAPEVRGSRPPLAGDLVVTGREGCDIAPIDVASPDDRQVLRSYVWPDQPARLERLDGALALAAETHFSLVRADAAAFVGRKLDARSHGACLVLFHSIMWQYMPQGTRDAIVAALAEAGARTHKGAPLAWLRMEPRDMADPFATLSLTLWPGGETRHLAHCDYHGRWIDWLA